MILAGFDVDPGLVRTAEGLAPRAAVADVTVSAGGSGFLAAVEDGPARLELWWPGDLPEPMVIGDVAVFGEVAPG